MGKNKVMEDVPKGKLETKSMPFIKVRVDEDMGVVDGLITVFGILDEGNDVSIPGSFTKTIVERTGKIRVCDNHRQESIMNILGKPLKLWEVDRTGLPESVRSKWPEATGGLMGSIQFFLDTPEGKGAFIRIKEGGVDEWSYTYDALNTDYDRIKDKNGHVVTARILKDVRLWEISPVLWGMNQATGVLDVKSGGEAKPWDIFKVGDKWGVYKVDADGNRTGDALGMHASEADANAQMAALHANMPDEKLAAVHIDPATKQDSLEDQAQDVASEFYAVYSDPTAVQPQYSPWIRATFPDYLIVEEGPACYRVPYTSDGSLVTFAPRDQWVEGEYSFIPTAAEGSPADVSPMPMMGYMSFTPKGEAKEKPGDVEAFIAWLGLRPVLEAKAGRVLAQRNVDRIIAAVQALEAALADAGVEMPDESTAQQTGAPDTVAKNRSIIKVKAEHDAPQSSEGKAKRAGPEIPPPTSEDLQRRLDVGAAELSLLDM